MLQDETEEKLIKYKKAVPKLENCIKKYHTLTIAQKNEMLKNLIDKVIYTKKERGTVHKTENIGKFTLEIKPKF